MSENTEKNKVLVLGSAGMVGSAIVRELKSNSDREILSPSRKDLDLTNQAAVRDYFCGNKILEVYLAAAKVGGIHANSAYPADFIDENIIIQSNVVNSSFNNSVEKLLLLGSSCIYPKYATQPIDESELLTGALEPTNEAYAIAKIAGLKLCEYYSKQYGVDYRSVMPCNLYGPFDNFHPENSHVIPALIRKLHLAKESGQASVEVWGSGKALREFLLVDDLASACVYVMSLSKAEYKEAVGDVSFLNVGAGKDISINDLVFMLADIVGYEGELKFDHSKPDGTPRKILNVSRLSSAGWKPGVKLADGLARTYEWYVENISEART